MKLTPSQRLMADDGAPSICFATIEQRTKWWAANPPTAMPLFNLEVRYRDAATEEFARQEAERKRQKSLAGIARMKTRMAMKAVDLTKMRWDPRRCKFVEDYSVSTSNQGLSRPTYVSAQGKPTPKVPTATGPGGKVGSGVADTSRVTKDNAEAIARLNGVWKDDYAKLRGTGRIVMTVGNLLRSKAKRGEEVKWA